MKKFIAIIVSAYSMCALFSAPMEANDTPTFAEKGHKSKSKSESKIIMTGPGCSSPGPCGPCGATGPKGGCSPVYATLVQSDPYPLDSETWIEDTEITVPLNNKQTVKGVTLDAGNNSFTLPKGVYTVHFQFQTGVENAAATAINFTEMYLNINGTTTVPLDWIQKYHTNFSFLWSTFSGSRTFSLATDSVVTFVLKREDVGGIKFLTLWDIFYPLPPGFIPNCVNITFQKINDV